MPTAQKHAIWFVPNYDNRGTTSGSAHPCTYLRLGSMVTTVDELAGSPEIRGDDLLVRAGITSSTTAWFNDDAASTNDGVDRNQTAAATVYKRYDGTGPEASTPATLTGELMTRGGWRDHTDGNRISTTRGDRIDFVQGNYKRVIFGRVTNSTGNISQSFWDSTGGHNHDSTTTPGEVTTITWVTTQGGTWKAIEKTVKGNVWERFSGEMEEHFDGGTEKHSFTGIDGGSKAQNPVIKENTYAKAIVGNTTCTSMESKMYASNANAVTWLHGSLKSTTHADSISEFSLAGIANGNTNTVVHEDVKTFKTRHEFTVIPLSLALNIVGWDFTQKGIRLVPYPFETPGPPKFAVGLGVFIGMKAEMFVGGKADADIGVLNLILRVGNSVEGFFGTKTTFKLLLIDGSLSETRANLAKQKAELVALKARAQVCDAHAVKLEGP